MGASYESWHHERSEKRLLRLVDAVVSWTNNLRFLNPITWVCTVSPLGISEWKFSDEFLSRIWDQRIRLIVRNHISWILLLTYLFFFIYQFCSRISEWFLLRLEKKPDIYLTGYGLICSLILKMRPSLQLSSHKKDFIRTFFFGSHIYGWLMGSLLN